MTSMLLTQSPLVAGFVLLLLLASFRLRGTAALSTWIAMGAILGSALMVAYYLPQDASFFGGALVVTATGKALAGICLLLAALAVALSNGYLEKVHADPSDWKLVVLACCLGIVCLSFAGDLATLFIAFELVSIPSYVLTGFSKRDPRSNEAGVKYLLLGMLGSALFLFGLAFLYGATGELHLQRISESLIGAERSRLELARIGMSLILAGLFFKVGAAPFHLWLADVYQGAPYGALTIISAPVKVAVFGLIFSLLMGPFASLAHWWQPVLLWVALISFVLGNLQALGQWNIKRLFAFSAVVNAGFLLLAMVTGSAPTLLLYLGAYGIMTVGLWAALMALGTERSDVDSIEDLRDIARRHPWMAVAMTVLMFSYAGIPLTVGFTAKFAVLAEMARGNLGLLGWSVLVAAVLTSLFSFYYYFRIVREMWFPASAVAHPQTPRHLRWNQLAVLAFSLLLILGWGVFFKFPLF